MALLQSRLPQRPADDDLSRSATRSQKKVSDTFSTMPRTGHIQRQTAETDIELSLDLDTSLLLSPEVEQTIFRIAEEALNNIARHASASRIEVRLSRDTAGAVTLSIGDNGRGFDPSTARAGHFGLRGIQERVAGLGGTLVLTSQPGSGTNILVKFRGDA